VGKMTKEKEHNGVLVDLTKDMICSYVGKKVSILRIHFIALKIDEQGQKETFSRLGDQ
jgi:hypothetical protein